MGSLFSRLNERQKRLFGWIALAAVFGLGIMVLQPPSANLKSSPDPELPASLSVKEQWEQELTAMLDGLLGGRRSQVLITLERGSKLVVAYSTTEEERLTPDGGEDRRWTSTPIILRDEGARKELPLVLEQEEPLIRGVLVIIHWDGHADLRWRVAQAVQTVLQVPMYRIEVLFKE